MSIAATSMRVARPVGSSRPAQGIQDEVSCFIHILEVQLLSGGGGSSRVSPKHYSKLLTGDAVIRSEQTVAIASSDDTRGGCPVDRFCVPFTTGNVRELHEVIDHVMPSCRHELIVDQAPCPAIRQQILFILMYKPNQLQSTVCHDTSAAGCDGTGGVDKIGYGGMVSVCMAAAWRNLGSPLS